MRPHATPPKGQQPAAGPEDRSPSATPALGTVGLPAAPVQPKLSAAQTLRATSYGPTARPAPAVLASLGIDAVWDAGTKAQALALALADQLVATAAVHTTVAWHTELLCAAAAIREHFAHVPAAATSADVGHRLAAVNWWSTTATLDLLLADRSWRVRSRVRGEVYDRQVWRFVRAMP